MWKFCSVLNAYELIVISDVVLRANDVITAVDLNFTIKKSLEDKEYILSKPVTEIANSSI